MSITTPEKKQAKATTPKKKTPTKKEKTPSKMKTPKAKAALLGAADDDKPKVKFSPKVMLFEGKMSLAESKAGLPDSPLASSVSKKSNLKKKLAAATAAAAAATTTTNDDAKKSLNFEPVEVDKKVIKLKEKIKKKRELMKALPNRKGLGHVDPKTKKIVKKKAGVATTAAAAGGAASAAVKGVKVLKLKRKKVKDGVGGVSGVAPKATGERKGGAAGAGIKDAKNAAKDPVLKVKKKSAAAAAASTTTTTPVILKVKKKAAAGAASTTTTAAATSSPAQQKGEKRKREDVGDGEQKKKKKKVLVAGGLAAAPKPTAPKPAAPKKPAALLSSKVYKQFHGKNTLTENKQKLFGMKKKERKTFRQQQKLGDNWSQLKEIKQIWESLRRATLDVEKRKTLCDALCAKIKGHVKTLSFMHDISRALQCLIKHATADQRDAIFDEIKGDLVEMSKNKYAKNFIKRIMDQGTKEQREVIMASFSAHVPELAKHADASKVLEYGVSNFSNASQRQAMVEEFYGPSYAFHKTSEHQSLEQLLNEKPEARNSILDFMKAKVLSHVEKQSFTTLVVQKATLEFLRLCGVFAKPEARQEVIERAREALVHVLHTHEGARIALHALWHGTAKDRKAILKSFKGHVVKIATDEHGYQVLLGAIDVTDDTKMMSKALIEELAASSESLTSVMESKHGRTVVYYLVHHRDPRHVHPDLLAILQAGDGNATSKKDAETRRRELAAASLPHLLRHLAGHVPALLKTKKGAVAVYTILEAAEGKEAEIAEARQAFDAVLDLVAAPFVDLDDAAGNNDADNSSSSVHPIADAGGHLCVKKIIQQNSAFASLLLARVDDAQLRSWAACNRGCFVLLALLEHKGGVVDGGVVNGVVDGGVNDGVVGKRVKEALEPIRAALQASDFPGAKLLTTKL